jgi:hypothetical protein
MGERDSSIEEAVSNQHSAVSRYEPGGKNVKARGKHGRNVQGLLNAEG